MPVAMDLAGFLGRGRSVRTCCPLVDLLPDACVILLPGLLLPEGMVGWLAAACARMSPGRAGACSGWAACLLPGAFTGSGERQRAETKHVCS